MDETSRVGDAAQSNTAAQKPSVDDVIIAAARESVMTVGFRRTSIAEIARKAGVSRPTVYRRYADIGELLAEVTNREILHMLEGLRYVPGDSRARMLLRIRIVVQRIIESDFFPGLVKTDPDRVLEALTGEMSDTQLEIVEKFILPGVRHGQEDGTIREHDPYQLARNIYRLIQTMVLVWRPDGKDAALDKKSVDMVDRYLRPDPADNKKD